MSRSWASGSTRAWRRLRRFVLERDAYRCQFVDPGASAVCGAFATHADHIVPRSIGGPDVAENLRAACARHNLSRGAGGKVGRLTTTRRRRPVNRGGWSW
jgi:5-methylcytosine-specific restriction endonuclease McrA